MRISILITLNDNEVERAITRAVARGFRREDPRRAWSNNERKQAVRFLAMRLIETDIGEQR